MPYQRVPAEGMDTELLNKWERAGWTLVGIVPGPAPEMVFYQQPPAAAHHVPEAETERFHVLRLPEVFRDVRDAVKEHSGAISRGWRTAFGAATAAGLLDSSNIDIALNYYRATRNWTFVASLQTGEDTLLVFRGPLTG